LEFSLFCTNNLPRVRDPVSLVKAGMENLRLSSDIPKILEIILAILNFVNSPTVIYSAFHIELLTQLKNIPTNNKSLLDYLVKLISEDYPDLLNWPDNIPDLTSSISWEQVEDVLKELIAESTKAQNYLDVSSQEFRDKISQYTKEIDDTLQIKQKTYQEWLELARDYGISGKTTSVQHFLRFSIYLLKILRRV